MSTMYNHELIVYFREINHVHITSCILFVKPSMYIIYNCLMTKVAPLLLSGFDHEILTFSDSLLLIFE